MAISPDGRRLVAAQPVADILPEWEAYKSDLATYRYLPETFANTDRSGTMRDWPWQYTYVDLDKRISRPIVAAPSSFLNGNNDVFQAVWSNDGERVLMTGTYLPLPRSEITEHSDIRKACAAAIYTVETGGTSCIAFSRSEKDEYLQSAEFDGTSHEVKLQWLASGRDQTEVFKEVGAVWKQQLGDGGPQPSQRLTLSLRQDLGVPPSLVATDHISGVSKVLWDPNPQLTNVQLGRAMVYHWTDSSGYVWSGGLVLPPDYHKGERYPLVIQTHGFYNEHEFLADGSFTSGFAAQPLAAAGIVVLQMEDRKDRHLLPALDEAPAAVAGFESATKQLDLDGLIDPERVGIIGFSRASWYVESALIDCSRCYKAATVIDGTDESYVQDILYAPQTPIVTRENEAANGAKPFGAGLTLWMKHAVGFNLDKVEAPVRIEAIRKMSVLSEWELYSSLTQQGKPVDLIYFPDGQHILQKPLERYASQQGNVDWFRFWLQGYERPNPEDPDQYKRWEHLRELQDADLRTITQPTAATSKPN